MQNGYYIAHLYAILYNRVLLFCLDQFLPFHAHTYKYLDAQNLAMYMSISCLTYLSFRTLCTIQIWMHSALLCPIFYDRLSSWSVTLHHHAFHIVYCILCYDTRLKLTMKCLNQHAKRLGCRVFVTGSSVLVDAIYINL